MNSATKDYITTLFEEYRQLADCQQVALREISLAELPEMVYNSNAIENSTLTLEDTEVILLRDKVSKDHSVREVYEAKNLAEIVGSLSQGPPRRLTPELVLSLHRTLLDGIDDSIAGRFRRDKEWVRVGTHVGANPTFVPGLVRSLIDQYNKNDDRDFLDKIAHFHAEIETIHPFVDGNGRMGRVIINLQLAQHGYPPIIIQNKSKHTDYYPLFDAYQREGRHKGFVNLFALLLQESLHKRIALLSSKKVIRLPEWARQNDVKGNIAANKAARQTIPAFRMSGRWMIASETKP